MNHDLLTIPDPLALPLEIWLQMLDEVCIGDDGRTGLALSRTSRGLRELSRGHRYRTISIKDHQQLIAFEEYSHSVPEDLQKMLNLHICIEALYDVAYPPDSWVPSEAASDDEDYQYSEPDAESSESEGSSSVYDEDSESVMYEYRDLTQDELDDLSRDVEWFTSVTPSLGTNGEDLLFPSLDFANGEDESCLLAAARSSLGQLEHQVYGALRRLLQVVAPTLQTLALSWNPWHTFQVDAVFPVLPQLRYLAVVASDMEPLSNSQLYRTPIQRPTPLPNLFPVLKTLVLDKWEVSIDAHGSQAVDPVLNSLPCITNLTLPVRMYL